MTTSSYRIRVITQFAKLATRPEGIVARNFLMERLREFQIVEIDFSGVVMTPSFADEFIGRLAPILGKEEFERRVILSNVPNQLIPLLELVVTRQLGNGHGAPAAKAAG